MSEQVTLESGREIIRRVQHNISKVIVGKEWIIEKLVLSVLARGHVLIEDVPGVGKTSLVRAVADSLGLTFRRLQFTPDLMPADVTGISIYEPARSSFRFQPGPVFTQVLLADEINRTSPKTQSALLEAMQERQVTVDGTTYPLPEPFFVFATQNPVEYEGTFQLPEAQIDRFTLKLSIGYPAPEEEFEIVRRHGRSGGWAGLQPVTGAAQILALQSLVDNVTCVPQLVDYIVGIVQKTRRHPDVYLGSSPRGSLALERCARALAFARGRQYVIPDDIKELVVPALEHRIMLKPEAKLSGVIGRSILEEIVRSAPVPAGQGASRG
ncbi:MAG: MoxR family ATPase [Bacillota bacterium]|nr:MoxR family ATPase [Bacillota bacterium]